MISLALLWCLVRRLHTQIEWLGLSPGIYVPQVLALRGGGRVLHCGPVYLSVL